MAAFGTEHFAQDTTGLHILDESSCTDAVI